MNIHPEYHLMTPAQKEIICNGAGAKGKWYNIFIPDNFFGLDMTEVFNYHDFAYFRGEVYQDKIDADNDMLINMYELIESSGVILRPVRELMALAYYYSVVQYGNRAFYEEQTWLN